MVSSTILSHVLEHERKHIKEMLKNLKSRCPDSRIVRVMTEAEKRIDCGYLDCGGDTSLLSEFCKSYKVIKGPFGRERIIFNGDIMYVPSVQYGRYIGKVEYRNEREGTNCSDSDGAICPSFTRPCT